MSHIKIINKNKPYHIVSKDTKVVLDGKEFVLEKGDKIALSESLEDKINDLKNDVFEALDIDADAHSDPAAANLWKYMGGLNVKELQQFRDDVINGKISYSDFYNI